MRCQESQELHWLKQPQVNPAMMASTKIKWSQKKRNKKGNKKRCTLMTFTSKMLEGTLWEKCGTSSHLSCSVCHCYQGWNQRGWSERAKGGRGIEVRVKSRSKRWCWNFHQVNQPWENKMWLIGKQNTQLGTNKTSQLSVILRMFLRRAHLSTSWMQTLLSMEALLFLRRAHLSMPWMQTLLSVKAQSLMGANLWLCKHSHLFHFLQWLIITSPSSWQLLPLWNTSRGPFASTGNVDDIFGAVVNICTFPLLVQLTGRPTGMILWVFPFYFCLLCPDCH